MSGSDRPLRPVQVILNGDRFLKVPDKPPGGSHTDFFQGDDAGFQQHKRTIQGDLDGIAETLRRERQPVGFVHVQMRENALAKSHRPLDRLFNASRNFSVVGGGANGEMIVQATPRALKEIVDVIEEKAELHPRVVFNEDTGKNELKPSEYRCELSAIGEVHLHTRNDRLTFDSNTAVSVLRRPDTIGSYIIDLFRIDPSQLSSGAVQAVVSSLLQALRSIPGGLIVRPALSDRLREQLAHPTLALTLRLLSDPSQRIVQLPAELRSLPALQPLLIGGPTAEPGAIATLDLNPTRHREVLEALAEQALVRSIQLPLILDEGATPNLAVGATTTLPSPDPTFDHPIMGIVDGGVAQIGTLQPWIAGASGQIPLADRNHDHGTFIAGLSAGAYHLNPTLADLIEGAGVKTYDLDLFPRKDLRSTYYSDYQVLFDQLDASVATARQQFNVRIFNFSFACGSPQQGTYSVYAEALDAIARKNNVIFVVSAGNLIGVDTRPTWPEDPLAAVQMLASQSQPQSITPPAEAFLAITVGAVNPPGFVSHQAMLPTTYTRRGPGAGFSRKPDLAHIGGVTADQTTGNRTGLTSLASDGSLCDNVGTSFAAPLVAASLATLDQRLLRRASRELLHALMIHQARRASPLQSKELRHIAPEFVGYGVPPRADLMLVDEPSSITIIFDQVLPAGRILEFDFAWPQSLVTTEGACKGHVDLTLVYSPPIDRAFNDEALRVELDAYLRQQEIDQDTGKTSWKGRTEADGSGVMPGMKKREKDMLRNGVKWSPVKRLHAHMPQGRGDRSEWKLVIEPLVRKDVIYPETGVHFAAILTISDIGGSAPVHDEMRNTLIRGGVRLADVQVASRVRQTA